MRVASQAGRRGEERGGGETRGGQGGEGDLIIRETEIVKECE